MAVALIWLVLAGRLTQLQWINRADLAKTASRQRSVVEKIPARPGEIVDRCGRLLATTITAHSLYVNPAAIADPKHVADELADVLGLDADALADRIVGNRDKHFLWIKRRLSDDEAERVRNRNLPAKTWGFREEYLRRYPQGRLAAHVIGLRDIDGIGRGGLEQSFDHLLRGRAGRRVLVRDARGKVIDVQEQTAAAPRHGRSIVLCLDAVIQLYAERELDRVVAQWKPRTACAIVLDPTNGEVLAMASRPTFDPNLPATVSAAAWKNTAIAAIYEPGSTFKPLVVAWALQTGVINADESFHCENGVYRMGRRVLHDHHPYGRLCVKDILVKSSNVGMAKIGERLTNRGLYEAVVAFGFGRVTGIELPGELPGIVRPLETWNVYSTGSVPMGQEIATTPLQLITAHAALANGGKLMNPRLVLKQTDVAPLRSDLPATAGTTATVVSQTVRPEIARWLVEQPLTDAVRRGTGRKAQLDGYTVFGKTGTAQKPDPATGGYSSHKHVSSFICGAPADAPRVLVLVVVDEPSVGSNHYGGTVAAPAASRILHKTLIHLRVPTNHKPLRSALR